MFFATRHSGQAFAGKLLFHRVIMALAAVGVLVVGPVRADTPSAPVASALVVSNAVPDRNRAPA